MIYDIIPLIIILVSLAVIIFLLIRKFPQLANIDVENIPKEQQADLKRTILENKFKRDVKIIFGKLAKLLSPPIDIFKNYYNRAKNKITLLEERVHFRHISFLKREPQKAKQAVIDLLLEGEKFIKDNNYPEAEKRFIKVLTLDSKNRVAYENLGIIYLDQKKYDYALETFEHLLNLELKEVERIKKIKNREKRETVLNEVNSRLAEIYFDITEIYHLTEEQEKAKKALKRALDISPNNPKYLDFFCELCIILKDKIEAQEYLAKLKEVNPENQKIQEIGERINQL